MDKAQVDKIFNRLRARLFNMVEQIGLDDTQLGSYRQTIKDITSAAWNDIAVEVEVETKVNKEKR